MSTPVRVRAAPPPRRTDSVRRKLSYVSVVGCQGGELERLSFQLTECSLNNENIRYITKRKSGAQELAAKLLRNPKRCNTIAHAIEWDQYIVYYIYYYIITLNFLTRHKYWVCTVCLIHLSISSLFASSSSISSMYIIQGVVLGRLAFLVFTRHCAPVPGESLYERLKDLTDTISKYPRKTTASFACCTL